MPRFFCESIREDLAVLTGEDAKHLSKVLRQKEGDAVTLCDGRGFDYDAVVTEITAETVTCQILRRSPSESEPKHRVILYQAFPKSDKPEIIVQKAVELGADEIVFLFTRYCVSRPDAKALEKRLVRLQRVSLEAAKQSGRGKIPTVRALPDLRAALSEMTSADLALFCYEKAVTPLRATLREHPSAASTAVLVGSEGGFSDEEAGTIAAAGVTAVSLGKRILRCETAPAAVLAAMLYEAGDME